MEWYYATNGEQKGPVSQEELIGLFQNGEVKASDLVWNDSMTDWAAYQTITELNPVAAAVSTEPGGSETPPSMEAGAVPATLTAAASTTPSSENVPTYLWQSIVCLILCCLPAAIPAIIFATKVEPALKRGDVEAAREASGKAKMWCWIAFGLGLVANIVAFIVGMAGAMAEQV